MHQTAFMYVLKEQLTHQVFIIKRLSSTDILDKAPQYL